MNVLGTRLAVAWNQAQNLWPLSLQPWATTSSRNSLHKRHYVQEASTYCIDKFSYPTTFCAWDSSPHLPVTPVQLMRPGIGWNASCTLGDFTWHLGLFFIQGCSNLVPRPKAVIVHVLHSCRFVAFLIWKLRCMSSRCEYNCVHAGCNTLFTAT